MSGQDYEIETIYRIYENDGGHCIQVGPCPDFVGTNVLISVPEGSEDYYGNVRMSLPKEQAKLLGEAILKACQITK